MNNNKLQTKTKNNSQQPETLKNKPTLRNVRQDKYAFQCVRTASRQPVTVENPMRTRRLNTQKPRSQKGHVNKKRSVSTTLYFEPIVWEKIQRYAWERGISFHKASVTLIEKSIQEEIIRSQIDLIKPIIEKTIAREMQEASVMLEALEDRLFPKRPIRRKN